MTDDDMITLVRTYFTAVDAEDLAGVLAVLDTECRFTVETHGICLTGHTQIRDMFDRLWSNHAAVLHDQFNYVPNAATGQIAAQFRVVNTEHDGSQTIKSNCNFFSARAGRFTTVAVYMAGQNTLQRSG